MAVADFIAGRRVLYHGGRRFAVRRPTYATVHRFLELYGTEIVAMHAANVAEPGCLSVDAALGVLGMDGRMQAVLETCVDTEAERGTWPLKDLARAAVELCDVVRIVASLSLPAAEGGEAQPEKPALLAGPTDQELSLVALARRFGLPPHTVADWPYEAFLATIECLDVMEAVPKEGGASGEFMDLVRRSARPAN